MTMWRGPEGYALPFYIASCDPVISGADPPISPCVGLHFEISVSLCNAWRRAPYIARIVLRSAGGLFLASTAHDCGVRAVVIRRAK
jgi:hypothetical protein